MKTYIPALAFIVAWSCMLVDTLRADAPAGSRQELRALIIDGQNNHEWKVTTPLLVKALQSSGRFQVKVETTPAAGEDMSSFGPQFANFDVIVSNYNGERWPAATEKDFVAYVEGGGGFVAVHAANNAFPDWHAYNRICGIGGWDGRNERWGPYVYFNNAGSKVLDHSPGEGGHHGPQHEFLIRTRDAEHPIMKGLPTLWMHTKDELYDSLRGPAEDMTILATAYSDPKYEGTARHEPMLMTLEYGAGRVFHTVLGHADYSMKCVGFITTLQRGTEWAATGKVTIPVPRDFPTADKTSSRD